MSSDDNNHLTRSSSLTNQYSKADPIQSTTSLNDIDDIKQQEEVSIIDTIPIIETTKCPSSSKQSSRMTSPALSTSSHSSARGITSMNQEIVQLPIYLEREILIKNNFEQLSKTKSFDRS